MSIRILASVVALVAIILFGWLPGTPSAATSPGSPMVEQTGQAQQTGKPMGMQDMQKMHEKMMADMKAEQAKLDALVAQMNAAKGEARTAIMADLLTEIVRGHGAMIDRMGMMHQHMMKMGK